MRVCVCMGITHASTGALGPEEGAGFQQGWVYRWGQAARCWELSAFTLPPATITALFWFLFVLLCFSYLSNYY